MLPIGRYPFPLHLWNIAFSTFSYKLIFLSWLLLLLLFLNYCFVLIRLVFGTVHCSLLYRSMVHSVLHGSTVHRK